MSLSHAKQIEKVRDNYPTSVHWAAEVLEEYGSDQDPIEFWDAGARVWHETTAQDLAYSQWLEEYPGDVQLKFYGKNGPQRGSMLAMIVDRIELRRSKEPVNLGYIAEALEYVVDCHEWCEHPVDHAHSCECGRSKTLCNDDGKCDGCRMRKKARRALKQVKENMV